MTKFFLGNFQEKSIFLNFPEKQHLHSDPWPPDFKPDWRCCNEVNQL